MRRPTATPWASSPTARRSASPPSRNCRSIRSRNSRWSRRSASSICCSRSTPSPNTRRLAISSRTPRHNPGKLNIGTIAVGGTQNLGAELFKSMADVKLPIVPFKRSPDMVVALLRNDVQMLVEFPAGHQRPGRQRQAACAGVVRRQARGGDAECADGRRSRRERLRGDVVERRVRAQGHAARSHRRP